MRKHQFIKQDCNCTKRATIWVCKFCETKEYRGLQEIRRLPPHQAECSHEDAPQVSPDERFKGLLGGTFDCLAPEAG